MKKQIKFLVYSFLGGIAFSIIVLLIVLFAVVRNNIVVDLIRQSVIKQNNRLEIADGEYDIIITREVRPAPELSIDCDEIRLTDTSGDRERENKLLPPNQEAIIEFTVKNGGGRANNVEVYWYGSHFPKGLDLTRIQEPIAKLGRSW